MLHDMRRFETIARRAHQFSERRIETEQSSHPFDERQISTALPSTVRDLFDNGHYAQATFEAYKFLDKEVQRHSRLAKAGFQLMMDAFGGNSPSVQITPMLTVSQQDEQKGYQFLFAGSTLAIRNPRGHEYSLIDDPDTCLDHLTLASMLVRRLAEAGFK